MVDGFVSMLGLKGLYELREIHFKPKGLTQQAFPA